MTPGEERERDRVALNRWRGVPVHVLHEFNELDRQAIARGVQVERREASMAERLLVEDARRRHGLGDFDRLRKEPK